MITSKILFEDIIKPFSVAAVPAPDDLVTVVISRASLERWQLLAETVAKYGAQVRDESGAPASNMRLWRQAFKEISDALSAATNLTPPIEPQTPDPGAGLQDDETLRGVLLIYDDAYSKAREGREFGNPCKAGTVEHAAYEIGTERGQEDRADFQNASACGESGQVSQNCDANTAPAALKRLESACDEIARLRTYEQYLSMIDGGQQEALSELDEARKQARVVLKNTNLPAHKEQQ